MLKPVSKCLSVLCAFILLLVLFGCRAGSPEPAPTPTATRKTYKDLVVGFSQVGAESEWRTGNTASITETAEQLGVELQFSDGQQQQETQIKAIRTFIAQRVDVIGFSPVVERGWDSVLQEAKDAGIPVILVDRRAAVPEGLYTSLMGSDFVEEGRRAGRAMVKLLDGKGKIVELTGTAGSAPAIDRYNGFREVLKDYPDIQIIASQDGDFTRASGKEVMEDILRRYGNQIDALFAHNDDMAIGAIKAIESYGLKPGVDIKIVSIDAIKDAFQAMIDGKLNATVECNPLLGPKFFELALKVANGELVPKWIPSDEDVYYPEDALRLLPTRKY